MKNIFKEKANISQTILEDLKQDYNYKLIATYNANVGSKQKDRLIREYYHISKK